jgi:hypothetical protein
MPRSFLLTSTLALMAVLGTSAIGRAETLKLDFKNVTPGLGVNYTLNGAGGSTTAGIYNWTIDQVGSRFGPQNSNNIPYEIKSLKDAPVPGIGTGGTGVNGPMGTPKDDYLRDLWGTFRSSVVDANTAAAFQIAVWEIVYDNGLVLNAGDFQITKINGKTLANTTVDDTAQTWLNQVGSGIGLTRENRLIALSYDVVGDKQDVQSQDQITLDPVPAPPALVLGAVGAAMCCFPGLRRRFGAKQA